MFCSLSCTRVLVFGEVIGIQLYSKVPFRCVYNKILGFIIEIWRRLIVISACSRSWSQFYMGESGYFEKKML